MTDQNDTPATQIIVTIALGLLFLAFVGMFIAAVLAPFVLVILALAGAL